MEIVAIYNRKRGIEGWPYGGRIELKSKPEGRFAAHLKNEQGFTGLGIRACWENGKYW